MNKITVRNIEIEIKGIDEEDYLNLTDLARIVNPKFPSYVVRNWMKLKSTIEYLGVWEQLNNENFNLTEFDQIKKETGSNAFVMTATKWIKRTNYGT